MQRLDLVIKRAENHVRDLEEPASPDKRSKSARKRSRRKAAAARKAGA